MKRRSDATMTILVMGLLSIALFGGVIVYYSQQTPILRLRPELEAKFGAAPFDTRFIAGDSPWIEVTPPPSLPLAGEYERAALGAWAIERYRELTEQRTLVTECWVRSPGDELPPLVVDVEMASMLSRAVEGQEQLREAALKQGLLEPAQVTIRGVVRSGVHARVEGRAPQGLSEEQRAKLTAKVAESLANWSYLSKVEVEVEAPGGARARAEAGRDVPKPKRPPRR